MKFGETFDPDIQFANPHIEDIPPRRWYVYTSWSGKIKSERVTVDFTSITPDELRKRINRPSSMLKVEGNWDTMNEWIHNIWEALYNPISLIPLPKSRIGVLHGHHRLRLLDAMQVNKIWYYRFSARIGRRKLPRNVKNMMKQNDKAPRVGTVSGTCLACGHHGRWVKITKNRYTDVRMFCQQCGEETLYPYPRTL